MSPKSALDLHLRNEQKLRRQQAWKKAVSDYADCLEDYDKLFWKSECNEIRREMESLERIWGPGMVGEARSLYNNRLNEQELEFRHMIEETKVIHRQVQYVAQHVETPEQYKNQQKRSSSEPPIPRGKSGWSRSRFF